MEIYFVNYDLSKLSKIEKTKFHHQFSRPTLIKILKQFYNIEAKIKEQKKKPYLEGNPMFFSISHSNSLFCYAISNEPVGVDVEFIKERNYGKILEYMGIFQKNPPQETFYQIWTAYEADFKLGKKNAENINFKYGEYFGAISAQQIRNYSFFEIENLNNQFIKKQVFPEILKKREQT